MREGKHLKDIEWSKVSMVHNLCRCFEFVFGREKGIRIENRTVQMGDVVHREFYTYEALFAFWEAEFYSFLFKPFRAIKKLKNIRIYKPVPIGYGLNNPIGYVFAVAEDNTTTENANESSSPDTTASHTTSGSDRGLIFSWNASFTSDGGNPSAITYNSTNLTSEVTKADYNRRSSLWSLIAPSTGANTGQVTWSGTAGDKVYGFITLTGVNQTDLVEATNSAQATYPTTTPSISVTTITDDAWAIGQFVNRENSTMTITTGTELFNVLGGGTGVGTCNGYSTGSAGSKSVAWSASGTEYGTMVIVAVKPADSGTDYPLTASLGTFTLTGIASAFNYATSIVASAGSFVLTGIANAFATGKGIVADGATFVLTGISVSFAGALSMVASAGSFTLTGISAVLDATAKIIAGTAEFLFTGVDARLRPSNIVKNVSKFVASVKNITKS